MAFTESLLLRKGHFLSRKRGRLFKKYFFRSLNGGFNPRKKGTFFTLKKSGGAQAPIAPPPPVPRPLHQGKEMRNISLNAHYIVLFKSTRDKQQISMLARQINPGKVQEFMRSYEDATRRPHGYLILDLKPTTDDQQRLKTNILPGEIAKFIQKQSYRQPPLVNAMYDTEQRMKEIMEAPQLSAVEKKQIIF